ncbi:phosphatidate cytidylyltransferase, mitochondrial-like, partial [Oppia nitens]|uniref:phosphatidate cytidylyltransferase, mitochondrial-like n=1 Tax=Oppia nitens TaxID=1686743 RepID=UPI0023DC1F0A
MTFTSNVSKSLLQQLIQQFPTRLSYAFAYGSGVFNQNVVKNTDKNMIDLIVVTEDSLDFHYHNLIKNRNHYSMLGSLGPKWLSTIQEKFSAYVYFNTLIPFNGHLIKYGVISNKQLISDCLDWQTLYISGRLHKPVVTLIEPNSNELSVAINKNTENAIHAALLLLSERFTEEELYMRIANISYIGDFRMTIGEDRQKIQKLVLPQIDNFRHLYQPILTSKALSQLVTWDPNSRIYSQDCSPKAKLYHLNMLPKSLEEILIKEWNQYNDHQFADVDYLFDSLAHSFECREQIQFAIKTIVEKSSTAQSLKGLFTAGLNKSIQYSAKKLYKMYKSLDLQTKLT